LQQLTIKIENKERLEQIYVGEKEFYLRIKTFTNKEEIHEFFSILFLFREKWSLKLEDYCRS